MRDPSSAGCAGECGYKVLPKGTIVPLGIIGITGEVFHREKCVLADW
jgi:hypothetical protein